MGEALWPAARPLRGEVVVPGDKSVSHRAILLASLSEGAGEVENFSPGADNRSTVSVCRALGAEIEVDEGSRRARVRGRGLGGLRSAPGALDCGNSGTTMRLMAGVLVGLGLGGELVGDASLMGRPMGRVAGPLRAQGGLVEAVGAGERAPLVVRAGSRFRGGEVALAVASAQVKSALLLAAVLSGEALSLTEPTASRDHTEVMLRALGVEIASSEHYEDPQAPGRAQVRLGAWRGPLPGARVEVPGDISSAAFLLVAGALVPGSDLWLRGCGAAPTRAGALRVLERAGVPITRAGARIAPGGEAVVDLHVRGELAGARALRVEAHEVPTLVDEVPILAVLAGMLPGVSVFEGLGELRVKESDRVERAAALLRACERHVEVEGDTLRVEGAPGRPYAPLAGYEARGDHRMAACALVAALAASGPGAVDSLESLGVSYPGLDAVLRGLQA